MTTLMKATGIFTVVSILFFANSARGQLPNSIYTIPTGTRISVGMDNEINSKVSSVGDTFTTTVSAPVIVRDVVLLPVGTVIEGRIVQVKPATLGKNKGSFEVKFDTLYLPGGKKQQIEAIWVNPIKSKSLQASHAVTIGGATAIGALIGSFFQKTKGALIGAGAGLGLGTSAVLLQKGEETRIKAGEKINIQLVRDVSLPPLDY